MGLSPEMVEQIRLAQAEAERRRLADQSVPVLHRTAKDLLAEGDTELAEALALAADMIVKANVAGLKFAKAQAGQESIGPAE